jgi:hypothetical protein
MAAVHTCVRGGFQPFAMQRRFLIFCFAEYSFGNAPAISSNSQFVRRPVENRLVFHRRSAKSETLSNPTHSAHRELYSPDTP